MLTALVVITQNLFLARSLRAGNFNLWFRHHWRMLLHLCTLSYLLLFLLMSLALGQQSWTRIEDFLSRTQTDSHQVQPEPSG